VEKKKNGSQAMPMLYTTPNIEWQIARAQNVRLRMIWRQGKSEMPRSGGGRWGVCGGDKVAVAVAEEGVGEGVEETEEAWGMEEDDDDEGLAEEEEASELAKKVA